MFGPQPAPNCLARLMADTHCRFAAPSPAVARAQREIKQRRARQSAAGLRKLLAAIRFAKAA